MCHYFINFSSCNNKFHLVIIVMTVIGQVPPEQMLRQTWMQIASLGGNSKKQSENWGSETRKDAKEQAIEGCSHQVLTPQHFEAALFKAEKTPTAGGSSQVKICRSFCRSLEGVWPGPKSIRHNNYVISHHVAVSLFFYLLWETQI